MSLYLPVHGSNNGSAQTHACDEADVKVLLEDERLHTGTQEQQCRVEETVPGWGTGVIDKQDQESGWDQEKGVATVTDCSSFIRFPPAMPITLQCCIHCSVSVSFSPEDLGSNEHEDVLDGLIEAGDEEVGSKCQTEHPQQGGLFHFLLCFHKQDFRLFHGLALFGLALTDQPRRVHGFLLSPGMKEVKTRGQSDVYYNQYVTQLTPVCTTNIQCSMHDEKM